MHFYRKTGGQLFMKRIFKITALLLSAALLCVSALGCDNDNSGTDNTDANTSSSANTGAAEQTSDTVNSNATAMSLSGEECNESFNKMLACASYVYGGSMAESEDSYYYLSVGADEYLYVIDKETYTCVPLCSKSDCLHEDELVKTECDAYLNSDCMTCYGGYLYYETKEAFTDSDGNTYYQYEICRMDLDGLNREIVFATEEIYLYSFKIHKDIIYLWGSPIVDGGSNTNTSALYSVPIGNGDLTELIPLYDYYDNKETIVDIRFCGDCFYLLFNTLSDCTFYQYDLTTDEIVSLSDTLEVNPDGCFTVFNDKLVFSNGKKIYECELDGTSEREVLNFSEGALQDYEYFNVFTNDGENIIITANSTDENLPNMLAFCDEDYNTSVYQLASGSVQAMAGCDSDVLIVYNEENLTLELYDKSALSEDTVAKPTVLCTFEEQ